MSFLTETIIDLKAKYKTNGIKIRRLEEKKGSNEEFDYVDDETVEKVKKLLKTVSNEPMYSSPTVGKESGEIHVFDKKRKHFIIKDGKISPAGK